MIYLYSGTPGSGKSMHSAKEIYYKLRFNHPVIANFDIDITKIKGATNENFSYVDNEKMTPKYLRQYAKRYFKNHKFKEGSITLFIDECQLLFNAREWNVKGRNEWLGFYTNHRKYGYDVILIAQFDRMIDRQIRSLIEYEYIHRKVGNFGKMGKLLKIFSFGELFICVERWYPLKEKVGSEFFRAKKKFYSIYDSYKTFDEDDEEEE